MTASKPSYGEMNLWRHKKSGLLLLSTFVVIAAHPDAHARNLNTDARLSMLLRTTLVVFTPRLVMAVLVNDQRTVMRTTLVVLTPLLVMLYIQHIVLVSRNAIGKRSCLGRADAQAGSASQ